MINQNQVLTNVKTCVESGVNKVFIINHQSPSNELIKCASYIKGLYPNLWVGVNMLDVHVNDVFYTISTLMVYGAIRHYL